MVEKVAERIGLRPVADGIEAGVRTHFPETPRVVVAARAQMKLLGPALFGIEAAENQHHVRREFNQLLMCGRMAAARAAEDRGRFVLCDRMAERVVQAVIAEPPAHRVEEIVALLERIDKLRSEEHTSELQSRFGISYAVFCLK